MLCAYSHTDTQSAAEGSIKYSLPAMFTSFTKRDFSGTRVPRSKIGLLSCMLLLLMSSLAAKGVIWWTLLTKPPTGHSPF